MSVIDLREPENICPTEFPEDIHHDCKETIADLKRDNAELRKLLTWLLSGPKCTCKDHDCRWQQEKCACGYDEKMQEALNACRD